MIHDDLAFTPAIEQAKLIRSKAVSPLELVELYLERIDRLDSHLGSYYSVASDRAIAEAKAKTEQLAQITDLDELPPFFGVPLSIKDLAPVKDLPWSRGIYALRNDIADFDVGVVTRLKQAGFVILGKTATSELGSLPYTEPPGFAPTRNPWNLDYTPGGSSGGAAAAVAAGLCPVAQASDGGGSVRGPAACCGLVGLKPSRGRISCYPAGERLMGLATSGVLARTVADAAALLDVMSGYSPGDPYWLPDPDPSFLEAARQQPGSLRVGFATEFAGMRRVDVEWEAAVLQTVRRLEQAGHHVEPIALDFQEIVAPFIKVWMSSVMTCGAPPDILSPMNRWIANQTLPIGDFVQALNQLHVCARRIVAHFEAIDVLVLPTYTHAPIRIGEWADLSPEDTLAKIIDWIVPCPPFNATGQPAIAIPAGFDGQGLPLSVQLVGKPGDELTIVTLAAQLEQIAGWGDRYPTF
jgi:amidase